MSILDPRLRVSAPVQARFQALVQVGWGLPAALCAVAAWLQAAWAAINESATWDEPYAILSGYLQVIAGDFRLTPENPPLLGLIVTAPLKVVGVLPPDLPTGPIAPGSVPSWGTTFLFQAGNRHDLALFFVRMAVMALTVLAMTLLVRTAHRAYGARGAWLCAALCAFEPNWIAHGHIAAWDGIATATMTLTVVALGGWLANPTKINAVLTGAGLGLALSAKHSALALGPVIILSLVVYLLTRPADEARRRWRSRAHLLQATGHSLIVLSVALFVLGASYNLRFDFASYVESARSIYRLNNPNYENYLLGEFRRGPFLSYYVVAWLVKTPSVSLPILLLGVVAFWRKASLRVVPALGLAVVMLIATAFNPYQIGIRHFLPAIPCLILLASSAATLTVSGRSLAPLALGLAGLGAVETLSQAPYPLAFFNRVVGGPEAALRYLDGSNIDWGQDLVALSVLQRRESLGRISLMYNGTAVPRAYGVDAEVFSWRQLQTPTPGRVYAVSLSRLHRARRAYGKRVPWLHEPPWRMAGRSIALYRFSD